MFCHRHPIPHEDCIDCRATVSAMRPTVFAELAAIELCAGTAECVGCGYVRYASAGGCPRCDTGEGLGHAAHRRQRQAPNAGNAPSATA